MVKVKGILVFKNVCHYIGHLKSPLFLFCSSLVIFSVFSLVCFSVNRLSPCASLPCSLNLPNAADLCALN